MVKLDWCNFDKDDVLRELERIFNDPACVSKIAVSAEDGESICLSTNPEKLDILAGTYLALTLYSDELAERLIADILRRNIAKIADWLITPSEELTLSCVYDEPVGFFLDAQHNRTEFNGCKIVLSADARGRTAYGFTVSLVNPCEASEVEGTLVPIP